jgi:transposase
VWYQTAKGIAKDQVRNLISKEYYMTLWGIDLHTNKFTVCFFEPEKGQKRRTWTYPLEGKGFNQFLACLRKDDYIAIETTGNSFWFHEQVSPYVKECFVLDTNKIKLDGNKTDKIDSSKILDYLCYYLLIAGLEEMPNVFVPSREVQELRAMFSTYRLSKKINTQLRNRIHSILKQNGIVVKRGTMESKIGREGILKIELPGKWNKQIIAMMNQLEIVITECNSLKDMIIIDGYQLFKKEIDLLITIKGFSPFTAVAFMTDVVDIDRFKSAKKICSYLRTAPKVKASNNTTHMKSTNKASRSLTCSLLTQSVNHIKVASPYFNNFYTRLRAGKSAGKSRMALIRKVIVSAYYMLKRNQEFKWQEEKNVERKRVEIQRIFRRYAKKKLA